MTLSEQQTATRRLAEWMGWRREGNYWRLPTGGQMPVDGWNPFSNLNHVRLVEIEIERLGLWEEYQLHLWAVCKAGGVPMNVVDAGLKGLRVGVRATAAQRAEACLKVIESANSGQV